MAAFDTTAYLNNKTAQLNKTGEGGRNDWTVADVQKAFKDSGLSAQEHYSRYGKDEGISTSRSSPRPSTVSSRFDTSTYLQNKAQQLNRTQQDGRTDWGVGDVQQAFADAGLSAQEHYNRYGAAEGVMPYAEAQSQGLLGSVPQTSVTGNQTSQGQLQQMLASNSPLMQQAATQGQQRANQRGLLNSSMGSQAAQGAMISAAAPFAQQDAQTYFQNSQANADRQQQDYMSRLGYQQQMGLNQQRFGFDQALNEQQHGFSMDQLQGSSVANAWGAMSGQVTDIVAQSMDAINNVQMNPNIKPEDKSAMIEQILEMRDSDIQFQGDLYDSLSSYLGDTGLFPSL
ncbi:hypothetical protein ACGTNG_12515 [Halomonas sp. 1390]|uniref:hypothetical protein n=1 Tax=Halomonas sp. B23F22_3 TaxID=3459516 RepID=UPI00373EF4CC